MRGLFGVLDYDLTMPNAVVNDGLGFLYGENGSGKTTILTLILHLLAPEPLAGHRTAIAAVPFCKIGIRLTNGAEVSAEREEAVKGRFTYRVTAPGGETVASLQPRKGALEEQPEEDRAIYARTCELLREIGVDVTLLLHDRSLLKGIGPATPSAPDETQLVLWEHAMTGALKRKQAGSSPAGPLERALAEARERLSVEAMRSRDSGVSQTDSIYSELVSRLTRRNDARLARKSPSLPELVARLASLQERSAGFDQFGLAPLLQVEETLTRLSESRLNHERSDVLAEVLHPYVTGVEARLNALESLRDALRLVVESLNSMYVNKFVTFNVIDGFKIYDHRTEAPLGPALLSSGEQQLLLLTCVALSSRSRTTILMIDEPELSLNVTWQKPLMRLLRACVAQQASSLLLATHSLEMMAPFRTNILRLERKAHGKGRTAQRAPRDFGAS